jgi:hypothetical protein
MKYDFIEIGTSDIETLIEKSENQIGLTIEPLQVYLDNLPNKEGVTKVRCAISDVDGVADIFWVHPADIELYNMAFWMRGCNSIHTIHPTAERVLKEMNLEPLMRKTQCKLLSWPTLVKRYDIESVEYLKIDTEGHDCVIINGIISSGMIPRPRIISFEFNELTSSNTTNDTMARLCSVGYENIPPPFGPSCDLFFEHKL